MSSAPSQSPNDFDAHTDRVVERYPPLASLRALLGPAATITPEFLAAYLHSPIHGVARERLLMAALGDLSHRSDPPQLSVPLALRTLDFLEHHPTQPLSPWAGRFEREHIPQRLRRIYAAVDPTVVSTTRDMRPRLDAQQFLRLALVGPAVRVLLQTSVAAGYAETPFTDPHVSARLAQLLPCFVLTEEGARRLLVEQKARHAFTHFFNTGHHALDLRNALLFYSEWLDRTDFEASARNKVSARIDMSLLGLARRGSHPLIALATQLVGLGVHGLLQEACSVWKDPVLGPAMHQLRAVRGSFEIESIARRHLTRWILDPGSIERWHVALSKDGPNSRYTSVILFDLQHLLDSESVPGLRQGLARHYRGLDSAAILQFTLEHYRAFDEDFAELLARAAARHPELFTGLRTRSLANSLFYARYLAAHGADPRVELPLSAMVCLGALRTSSGAAAPTRASSTPRPGKRHATRNLTNLPLLDQLMPEVLASRERRRSTPSSKAIHAAVLGLGATLARIRNEHTVSASSARRRSY